MRLPRPFRRKRPPANVGTINVAIKGDASDLLAELDLIQARVDSIDSGLDDLAALREIEDKLYIRRLTHNQLRALLLNTAGAASAVCLKTHPDEVVPADDLARAVEMILTAFDEGHLPGP